MRHPLLWSCLALSSCVVGSFNIVDELSGDGGSAGTAMAAGQTNGGTPGASGNAPTAGRPQGGNPGQAGSSSQAGSPPSDGGEPPIGEGGAAGAGGAPADVVAPCDLDSKGMPPLLCDDFESGKLEQARWQPPPGVTPIAQAGPQGQQTVLVPLANVQLESVGLDDLGLSAAGAEVTVSFWVRAIVGAQNRPTLMTFRSIGGQPIRLVMQEKQLAWSLPNMTTAPSKATGAPVADVGLWYCVALYLTATNMNISYYQAENRNAVATFIIDETPTSPYDDLWVTQTPPQRRILGTPAFGGEPTMPSEVIIDDVRIATGKSNVCGL